MTGVIPYFDIYPNIILPAYIWKYANMRIDYIYYSFIMYAASVMWNELKFRQLIQFIDTPA